MSNPWKPNKPSQPPTTTQPPSNASKPNPPWMKNKSQQPPQQEKPKQQIKQPPSEPKQQTKGNSAPWMKNKAEKQQNPPQPKPQVKAQNPPQQNKTENKKSPPAWMKNKNPTSNGPPSGNPPTTNTNSPSKGGTPWMKGKPNQPTDRSGESSQKQQPQENKEETEKKEQPQNIEEPERKEEEDEKEESEEEEVEEQKPKKKPMKKVKSTKSLSKKSSPKKSPTKSVKKTSNSTFLKYLELLNQSISKEYDYEQKIEAQKDFIKCIKEFTSEASEKLTNYLKQKKVVQRKRNVLNFENVQVEYALGDGVTIDNKTTFKMSAVETLINKFKLYQLLQTVMVKLVKKLTVFRIRVPLLCLVEYKGIQFLCEGVSEELIEVIGSPASNFTELTSELIQIQKQLKDLGYEAINRNHFSLKKLEASNQQTYILYLNDNFYTKYQLSAPEVRNLTNLSELGQGRIEFSLEQSKLIDLKRISTEKFLSYIHVFELAQAIEAVYRSCQGETNQQSFWSLVFQENPAVWEMIRSAHQDRTKNLEMEVNLPNKAILIKIIECLLPIKFKAEEDIFYSEKEILQSTTPKILAYKFNSLEIFEVFLNFDKYTREDKLDLAEESIKIQKQLLETGGQLFISQALITRNEVNLSLSKKQYEKVIELIQQKLRDLPALEFDKIFLLPLLITAYMFNGNEIKMLESLGSLLDVLGYYFKEEMWVHSFVYSMMGEYYSKTDHGEEAKKFMECSYQIINHCFGVRSLELAEVMIEKASIELNLNEPESCIKTIQEALKIYKSSSKHSLKIVECLSIIGKAKIIENNKESGKQLIDRCIADYLKLEQPKEAMNLYFFLIELGMNGTEGDKDRNLQGYLEKIAQIGFNYKHYGAVKEVVKHVLLREIRSFTSDRYQSLKNLEMREQSAIDELALEVEEQARNFGSFVEMVKWSIQVVCLKNNSAEWDRAANIMTDILGFFRTQEREQLMA